MKTECRLTFFLSSALFLPFTVELGRKREGKTVCTAQLYTTFLTKLNKQQFSFVVSSVAFVAGRLSDIRPAVRDICRLNMSHVCFHYCSNPVLLASTFHATRYFILTITWFSSFKIGPGMKTKTSGKPIILKMQEMVCYIPVFQDHSTQMSLVSNFISSTFDVTNRDIDKNTKESQQC